MTETELFIQLLINGITIGSYLALIALGYTMVYGIIQLINFAHGDVYILGFLISLTFLGFLDVNRTLGGWQLWVITFGVMSVTMLCTSSQFPEWWSGCAPPPRRILNVLGFVRYSCGQCIDCRARDGVNAGRFPDCCKWFERPVLALPEDRNRSVALLRVGR